MYKEPEKLIKSPMDMGKFQRSEGYRKGLLLYHYKIQIRKYYCEKWTEIRTENVHI